MTASLDPFAPEGWAENVAPIRQNPDAGLRRLTLTRASEITLRATMWLWDKRIPTGALTLIAGREGIGKSTFAYKLVADVTKGLMEGRYFGVPKSVLIVATEDSWSQTIVPRLIAAGADLERVFRVDATTHDGVESQMKLNRDLVAIEGHLNEQQAALILLDPLMSRLGDSTDTHKDADVRKDLEPLVAMADRAGCAVLGLIHLSKGHSTDPLTLIMGSRAFAAVARAVLFVMKDPEDDNLRMVGQEKNNLGSSDLPVLTFTIESVKVGETDEGAITTGRLKWAGESTRSIKDALESTHESEDARCAWQEAGDWLLDYLMLNGGEAEHAAIKKAGVAAGHSYDAIKRARRKLGVPSNNTKTVPRTSVWSLPPQSEHPSEGSSGESALTARTARTGDEGPAVGAVRAVGAVGEAPVSACTDCGWDLDMLGHLEACDGAL